MSDAGELNLRINWDGRAVLSVEVESTRPQASRLLAGRTPQQAVQMVSLLYSVCGKAQQAAATAAFAAARGRQGTVPDRIVACEAVQEHLWRLMLDWPQLLDLPPAQQPFVDWHGRLRAIAAGAGGVLGLRDEISQQLLGLSMEAWRSIASYADLSNWWRAGYGLAAPLAATLDRHEGEREAIETATCELLPDWTVDEALQACAGHFDLEFSARPHNGGKPMEVGALAYRQHAPLLQDVMRVRPGRLLARLIARLVDLQDSVEVLARGGDADSIASAAVADGAGIALVRTARGPLLHYVSLDSTTETVAQYFVVAPTEWNFHPQGALATGLTGVGATDEEQLMETARMRVLSLDPCVEYRIEVVHA